MQPNGPVWPAPTHGRLDLNDALPIDSCDAIVI